MVPVARTYSQPISHLLMAFAAAVLATALAGGILAPADSVNILAAYWTAPAIAILVLVAWLVRPARLPAITLIGGYLAGAAILFAPLLPAAASASAAPSLSVRVVSFNMLHFNPDAMIAAEWVLKQQPDFVILLEASPANGRAIDLMRQSLPHAYNCVSRGSCSTMILSRVPATDVWPWARGDADNRRALSAVTARFDLSGLTIPITAVHLSHPWPLGDQASQLGDLEAGLATVGRNGIMAGDFNSVPWTFAMRGLASSGGLRLASGGAGTWPSERPALLRLPLDQVYVGPCFTTTAVRRGPYLGSDHLPLVADITAHDCKAG